MRANEERKRLKKEYGELLETVTEILRRHDPIRISSGENDREYDPEASAILPRLRECASESDVLTVVHQTFRDWFDASTVGPIDAYAEVAREIWEVWRTRHAGPSAG